MEIKTLSPKVITPIHTNKHQQQKIDRSPFAIIQNKTFLKLCHKCNTYLEASTRHFYKDKTHNDNLSSICKGCRKSYLRTYRKHPDFKKQAHLYWLKKYAKDRDKLLARSREHYYKNKTRINKKRVEDRRRRRLEKQKLEYEEHRRAIAKFNDLILY